MPPMSVATTKRMVPSVIMLRSSRLTWATSTTRRAGANSGPAWDDASLFENVVSDSGDDATRNPTWLAGCWAKQLGQSPKGFGGGERPAFQGSHTSRADYFHRCRPSPTCLTHGPPGCGWEGGLSGD